jgi:hypothetical protein
MTFWEKWGPIYGERAKEDSRGTDERNAYDIYYEWYLFRVGYIAFALGEYKKAAYSFRKHLDFMASLKSRRPGTVVHAQRTKTLLDYIEGFIMTAAPELACENLWAGNRPFSLEKATGKVLAVVFRGYEVDRIHPTLKYLEQVYRSSGAAEGPFTPVTVAYLKGFGDPKDQLAAVEREANELGITYPCGLDPTEGKDLFKAYEVNVGSSSLVIVDRLGRIAYMEQDPRPNAHGLFRRVIERLVKE